MHHDDYVEDGTPVINPMHIVDGRIVPDPRHAVGKAKLKALSRYLLHEGDVIIGRRGEMGRCAVVGPAEEGMVCGSGSAVIRLDASKVMAVYMGALLSSSRIKKLLEERALGVTMLNLNSQIISDLVIPVPPISQQQEFVQALEKVQDQKALALASVSQLASLFSSLQHRTLRGEL
jgi:type I restriction enzyme S subunit